MNKSNSVRTAKSNAERQNSLRQNREKLGLKRKEFWLNEKELEAVKGFIIKLRKQNGG